MSLVLPSELVVDRFLPTVRAMLATRLADRGLTQQEIAAELGVTQAAVSKYVAGESGGDDRFRDHPETVDTVERIADGLADGEMDGYDALAELLALIRTLEDRGPICELHEEEMPALRGLGCDLCVRGLDADVRAERDALANVRTAARTLASTPGMAALIPNVGTNIGMALPEARDETDVAAIPGRIYAMSGRIEIPANPEFGASKHVATAVLAALDTDPDVRGALNVATDDDVLAAAAELGYEPLEFDAAYEDRGEHLRERFGERGAVPRVAYHRGAFGIEPATFVFGTTAADAVELLGELFDQASGSR
ncbi:thiamine-phosphate synthase family protein [Natronolimnohabitans innermongolicus]|uniref:XRE family transcriptional regulator n=1 Tax=Natronolimnohabitans innermongolicus JCM 12255 TaxID=1227499 RepID=L9WMS5_9EURY|nr:thiamine-phosphate synthase family protein [Natronolimnohabitans innermongolicus]ELY49638.1 XRE family transcriptional regulator [Natronolimnohabitans innermongolicus JCM 12255]